MMLVERDMSVPIKTHQLEDASLILNEVGATSNFDFALAAEFSPSFSLGGSVSFTSLDYEYTSFYQEKHSGVDAKAGQYGLSLDSKQSISGLGVRFALGALVRSCGGSAFGC